MKRATKAVMTAMAVPIAAALPLTIGGGSMPVALAAATAASPLIPPGPATVLHHGPTPWAMDDYLGGALCEPPKVCKEVRYDWIQPYGPIEIGAPENVARLDAAIHRESSDPKIVYAYSGGARIASIWLRDHADDKDAPAPEDLSFVLLGNGGRKYGGVNGWFWGDLLRTPTETQYDVVDVAKEYDPIADFPTNPFNLLAVANGIAAFAYVHLRYDEVDLDDPDNIVWKEGTTTYVFVPTEHLPLLQGFYDAGMGDLVKDLEPKLREIIDQAYNRTWLEGKPIQGELNGETEKAEKTDKALKVEETEKTDPAPVADKTASKHPLLDALLGHKTADKDAEDTKDAEDAKDTEDGATDAKGGATDESDGDATGAGTGESTDTEKPDTEKPNTEKPDTEKPDAEKPAKAAAEKPDTEKPAKADAGTDTGSKTTGKHRAPLKGTAKAEKAAAASASAGGSTSDSAS